MNFEDRLAEVMKSKAEAVDGPSSMPTTVRSRYRRRMFLTVALGLVTLVTVSAASVVAVANLRNDRGHSVTEEPAKETYECPPDDQPHTDKDAKWTSPVVEVARGSFEGRPWLYCVRTVESPSREKPDKDRPELKEGLCVYWRFDMSRDRIFDFCGFNGLPLDENYFSFGGATGEPDKGPDFYLGAIPAAAATVELRVNGGETEMSSVYAPEELPFKFFVGILAEPVQTSVKLVARDAEGEEIVRHNFGPN